MRRHGEPAKENRRPPGTNLQLRHCSSNLLRRPLGERKPCKKSPRSGADNAATAVDVAPCLKWLEATVAQSRVIAAAAKQPDPVQVSPPRSSGTAGNHIAPPAQPSCSPDILRKKASRDLDGCFGIGPTVKGDVKDRRKSKPRALLTVEALPKVATILHKEKKVPRPGRASLEWISDDPDSESTTDISGTCDGSSGDSSLCSGFLQQDLLERWHHLRASKIYSRLDVDSDASFSDSWDTVPHCWHEEKAIGSSPLAEKKSDETSELMKHQVQDASLPSQLSFKDSETEITVFSSQMETVMGAYESCHRRLGTFTGSIDQQECDKMKPSLPQLVVADALRKMSFSQIREQSPPEVEKEVAELTRPEDELFPNGFDSISEKVRGLQIELKELLCSDSWQTK
ncbi:uncharacterized protein LOC112342668 [Selaginella moellendorffii]|uniref:uncharacterized protein LOC112342668 n=1 Tax=Selaginella moellendorffii TaxID=88036 RepID=UPI000D1D0606|nr:uncharacterized protein LOC112342668 [Selaginella moellendorffii]|eukprot:XP_024520574.1 uncharacterized protein LOC112342668 [Selaginella moellendorffii]